MTIIVVGISHKTAPLALREQLAFGEADISLALQDIKQNTDIDEAMILSTCNRTEFYCAAENSEAIFAWLAGYKKLTPEVLNYQHFYVREDLHAVEHLMKVASGLDSMILGEPEILGQVKSAYAEACLQESIGQHLSYLLRRVFNVAKKVRTTTRIGACPVSVASTAVSYVKQWLEERNETIIDKHVLIIGAGDTGELATKHIAAHSPAQLTIASRQIAHADALAREHRAGAIALSDVLDVLHDVDVVISATASQTCILSQQDVDGCLSREKNYLFMDLAVPRDIDPMLNEIDNVDLLTVDDLKSVIQEHVNIREHAAEQALKMITDSARDFMLAMRGLHADEVIKAYRKKVERFQQEELNKILKANDQDDRVAEALSAFSQTLLNKIMHAPCERLRQACYEGRPEVVEWARELLLTETEVEVEA